MTTNYDAIIADFAEGAEKIVKQLRDWTIGSVEARRLERQAFGLWCEDAEKLGLSRAEAKKIWQEKIVDNILLASDDPAWI